MLKNRIPLQLLTLLAIAATSAGCVGSFETETAHPEGWLLEASCGECEGKVTDLSLRYLGDSTATIRGEQKKNNVVVFEGDVDAGATFAFVGQDRNGTLGTEIIIFVDGSANDNDSLACAVAFREGLDGRLRVGHPREQTIIATHPEAPIPALIPT